jgi:hypothetical protein
MDDSDRIQLRGMRLLIFDVDHEVNGSGRLVVVDGGAAPACSGTGGDSPEQAVTAAPVH